MKGKKDSEEEVAICTLCGSEIHGSHECIKTKRRTELHICKNCVASALSTKKQLGG